MTQFDHDPALEEDVLHDKSLLKNVMIRFMITLSIFTLIFAALGFYWYQEYTKNLEEKLLSQEEAFIATTTHSLQKEMQVQLIVLNMVSKSKVVTGYFENNINPADKASLVELFRNLTNAFEHYGQIRLFDLNGEELIRVNYNDGTPIQVPNSQLQNKYNRYYFQQALSLAPGETYVSKMDLNVENEKIEIPYKPTLRFATQILDNNGQPIGIVMINYLANELLENFRHQIKLRINGQGMLIDEQGYWLSNHDRSNEWGVSLGKPKNNFEQRYPLAWPTIKKSNSGTLKTEKGLFRYQSITPLDFSAINSPKHTTHSKVNFPVSEESTHNTNWKLVIFLPNETIQESSLFYKPSSHIIIVLLYVSIAFIMLMLISNSEQKKARRTHHKRISSELKDLYENAPCGYHSLDAQGIVTRINQTELNWLGYERDEVIGRSFSNFITPASQETFKAFLDHLPNEQEIDGVILEVQTKQGNTFFVSTSAVALFNEGNFAIARTSAFDITDRIELEKRLEYIAHTDVLTGISNRRHFFEQVTPVFIDHQKSQKPLSLLMIDVDHFKQVNDVYGHDAGDIVLQQLSEIVKHNITNSDLLARLGGEEFVVVMQNTQDKGYALAEHIRKTVSATSIQISDSTQLNITLSIGVSVNQPQCTDIDDMIKQADIALYKAKTKGRNRVVLFNKEEMQKECDDDI
ncbi:sensor domain-containing diguanylate cyclase [Vibrio rumoiensis]|uniref:Diguanylate cyclase n=1 Tax=Vibrio rumoiensis 1S-45 TaxID=1188252 RepID=A0A1E5DYJ6_9VIBR|nr:diguanylate cyclase [Vibrio rumoiensis]OEF22726.1 hypothetical protein A1QC_02880 [Vibrio rumoiensis 1S-45]